MISSVFWVLLIGFGSVSSQVKHSLMYTYTFSNSTNFAKDYLMNGLVIGILDFEKQIVVNLFPEPMKPPKCVGWCYEGTGYNDALLQKQNSKINFDFLTIEEKELPVTNDPPVVTLYPKHYEEVGVNNTLVCLVDQFYPPPVTVRWTRNLQQVTEGTQTGRNLPKADGSFHMFATLDFTLEEGDVYTCSVEHQALDAPLTRTWELEVSRPSVGPAVFCGVGLAVGLVGVAAGTVLFVKGKRRQ